ncbi:unnamed protein product [Arctogadus glacialis]
MTAATGSIKTPQRNMESSYSGAAMPVEPAALGNLFRGTDRCERWRWENPRCGNVGVHYCPSSLYTDSPPLVTAIAKSCLRCAACGSDWPEALRRRKPSGASRCALTPQHRGSGLADWDHVTMYQGGPRVPAVTADVQAPADSTPTCPSITQATSCLGNPKAQSTERCGL